MAKAKRSAKKSPKAPGGGGTLLAREDNYRADLSMVQRALKGGWEVPAATKKTLPKLCAKVAADEDIDPAVRLKAAQTLVMMHRDNTRALAELLASHKQDAAAPAPTTVNNTQINLNGMSLDERRLLLELLRRSRPDADGG